MRLRIDAASRTPVSVQLRDAIAGRIVSGGLAPGDRLPPVRELAGEMGLAPNTVAKAYRGLEAAGFLTGRGRHGTFVADVLPTPAGDGEALLEDAARAFAVRVRWLGVPPARALAAARRALRASPPS